MINKRWFSRCLPSGYIFSHFSFHVIREHGQDKVDRKMFRTKIVCSKQFSPFSGQNASLFLTVLIWCTARKASSKFDSIIDRFIVINSMETTKFDLVYIWFKTFTLQTLGTNSNMRRNLNVFTLKCLYHSWLQFKPHQTSQSLDRITKIYNFI